MTVDRESFIKSKFREFYESSSSKIEAPPSIEMREFGFLLFKGKVMVRHKGFRDVESLRSFLRGIVPLHAYYSAAYYVAPEEPMERKGWVGADLYFDIDADHIPTPCRKLHDVWVCRGCGFKGRGAHPDKCPICGRQSFTEKTWPCEVCLEAARRETIKLVDILSEDFGLSQSEIKVSFSGHRGYHVKVESDEMKGLDSTARKEIADYVTGTGLDAKFHGLEATEGGAGPLAGPHLGDSGWRGRIARGVYDFLLKADRESLERIGLRRNVVEAILENREAVVRSWDYGGPWGILRGVGLQSWKLIIKKGVEAQAAKIDTVVTTDIHRLIRLENTLHGKTGLLKVAFPTDEIEVFDPFKSAVAFKRGEVTVFIEEAPEFRIGEEVFGPFRDEKVELPLSAALLLLCKGMAEVTQ